MNKLFLALRESFENNSKLLQNGKVFHPSYLKEKKFTKSIFPKIAHDLQKRLKLHIDREVSNKFPNDFKVYKRQIVDYVFGDPQHPKFFLELESIDRAQLYLFLADEDQLDNSKLWHYWATVCKRNNGDRAMPRYFIFLLVLPEKRVRNFPFWDAHAYKLLSPRLRNLIQDNPFSFYDRMIKTSARLFLEKRQDLINRQGKWVKDSLKNYQNRCELVFITATERQLILSRGKDYFDPSKEKYRPIRWKQVLKK
jgi:hypothetical protein